LIVNIAVTLKQHIEQINIKVAHLGAVRGTR